MIYSVFDWNKDSEQKGHYVYFEGNGEGLGVRPKPKQVWADNRGHKLEELLPEVPAGSKMVGRGEHPKGRIAVLNASLRASLGEENPVVTHPWLTLAGWAGVIVGGFYVARWLGQRAVR